jgi:hypothetical protein
VPGIDAEQARALREAEAQAIKPLDTPTPPQQTVEIVILKLTELIAAHPTYTSTYLNRAQANQLLMGESGFSLGHSAQIKSVLMDLNRAIELASPASRTAAVSQAQAELLAKAHTHRAYLIHMMTKPDIPTDLVQKLPGGKGVDYLEDKASRSFQAGGAYGNTVAARMSVATNPYAKLCEYIVKETTKKELSSFCAYEIHPI